MSPPAEPAAPPPRQGAVGSAFGMKLIALMLRLLPTQVAYAVAYIPVIWYFLVKGDARRAAAKLHERLGLPGGAWRRFWFGLRQAVQFSRIILDNMYLGLFGPQSFIIDEFGTDIFKRLLSEGNGLMLLSAHMGNWHLAVNFLGNTDTTVHLVIADNRHEEVRRQMDAAKKASCHLVVHPAVGDEGLVFTLSSALRRGEVVIIAGDRGPATGRRAHIPFLGEPAWFPTSPLAIAAAVGAPVCTALTFRIGTRRYACHGLGPFAANADTKSKKKQIDAMAREFAAHLETFIRRYPTQWFNFYDFWKAR